MVHGLWQDACRRVQQRYPQQWWTTDAIQQLLQLVEYTVHHGVGWQRYLGRVTEPPQVIAGHLVVWTFLFDDRHCEVWPLDIVGPVLKAASLDPIALKAAA